MIPLKNIKYVSWNLFGLTGSFFDVNILIDIFFCSFRLKIGFPIFNIQYSDFEMFCSTFMGLILITKFMLNFYIIPFTASGFVILIYLLSI